MKRSKKDINEERIYSYKCLHPCVDCGEKDPRVLDFHHVKGNKIENVSNMPGKYSWKKIIAEIKKCDILCANCHRKRTSKNGNYYTYNLDNTQMKFKRAIYSDKILTNEGLINEEEYYKEKGPSNDISYLLDSE